MSDVVNRKITLQEGKTSLTLKERGPRYGEKIIGVTVQDGGTNETRRYRFRSRDLGDILEISCGDSLKVVEEKVASASSAYEPNKKRRKEIIRQNNAIWHNMPDSHKFCGYDPTWGM